MNKTKITQVNQMRTLSLEEANCVNGGLHINIGALVAACAVGLISGGPVGLGMAIGGIIINEGINNLDDLRKK